MFDKINYLNGLGYIGLLTASLLGTKGFQVHGVGVSEHVVNIKKGKKQDLPRDLGGQEYCEASDLTSFYLEKQSGY
jgi:UDP-N-acetyl-D-mannosaminuronate dehydrogenase